MLFVLSGKQAVSMVDASNSFGTGVNYKYKWNACDDTAIIIDIDDDIFVVVVFILFFFFDFGFMRSVTHINTIHMDDVRSPHRCCI